MQANRHMPLVAMTAFYGVALTGSISSAASGQAGRIPHVEAVGGILGILDSVPLVAIGDLHGSAEEGEFYQRLIRHPQFPGKVNDLILELGNELYQPVADRYVNGESVPLDSVRMIWENTTQGPLITATAPMYTSLFTAVREVNSKLPPARRVRILLGDPAVEWETVTREELWSIHARRGDRMREIARDSVIARGRRAVIIAGFRHLVRDPQPASGSDAKWGDLASKVFVIRPHDGFGGTSSRHESAIDSLPPGSLIRLRDTFIGELEVNDVDLATPPPGNLSAITAPLVIPQGMRAVNAGRKLRDIADGYLYVAPFRSMTFSRPDIERIRQDPARLEALHRRSCIMMGRPVDTAALFRAPQANLRHRTGVRRTEVHLQPVAAPPSAPPPLPPALPEPCGRLLQSR